MLVIQNAKVYTSAKTVYDRGDILIRDGKIAAVSPDLDIPGDARIIDAAGLAATPGLVDGHSHIGTFATSMGDQDANELTNPCNPELSILPAIDPDSPMFAQWAAKGVTSTAILPGSGNSLGGLVGAFKCRTGSTVDEMCIRYPVALKGALSIGAKTIYGKRGIFPATKGGAVNLMRNAFYRAAEYEEKRRLAAGDPAKMPPYDAGCESLAMVLRREIPFKVHCEQHEILNVMRLGRELDILYTIDHAFGASDFYEDFARAENLVGVVYGPIGALQRLPGEMGKYDIEAVLELDRRGITVCIMSDCPAQTADALLLQGGEAVRAGGKPETVLEMLTINAAKILGIDGRIGSLEPGKDGDIALFEGMPCVDTAARVCMTVLDGEIVYSTMQG